MPNRTPVRHKAAGFEMAPTWHELVQPGPKGDPKKAAKRAAARRVGVIEKPFTGMNREMRRAVGGRGYNPGRLVLHRTRLHPVEGGPRPKVKYLRVIRHLSRFGVR